MERQMEEVNEKNRNDDLSAEQISRDSEEIEEQDKNTHMHAQRMRMKENVTERGEGDRIYLARLLDAGNGCLYLGRGGRG